MEGETGKGKKSSFPSALIIKEIGKLACQSVGDTLLQSYFDWVVYIIRIRDIRNGHSSRIQHTNVLIQLMIRIDWSRKQQQIIISHVTTSQSDIL